MKNETELWSVCDDLQADVAPHLDAVAERVVEVATQVAGPDFLVDVPELAGEIGKPDARVAVDDRIEVLVQHAVDVDASACPASA